MKADFGKTARDYGRHRAGFPDAFFERVADAWAIGLPGQRILDLGTGTGALARRFAAGGARVTGLDPARPLLDEGARLAAEAGIVEVTWVEATAEATGQVDGRFDAVSAGQCWHWFDGPAVAAEVVRVLAPGGSVLVAHLDWLPRRGNVVEATEALIAAHNPAWDLGGGTGLYPRWLTQLADAGFGAIESFSFDVDIPYDHEDWRGRIRASAGVAASLDQDAVARFDAAHAAVLAARFPGRLAVPHRVFAVRGVKA